MCPIFDSFNQKLLQYIKKSFEGVQLDVKTIEFHLHHYTKFHDCHHPNGDAIKRNYVTCNFNKHKYPTHLVLVVLESKLSYSKALSYTAPCCTDPADIRFFGGPKFFQIHGFPNIGHSFDP